MVSERSRNLSTFEVDLTPGVMFNATNPATQYHTGTEFHLDWLIGQHVSDMLAFGVTGYVYRQISDDGGVIPLGIDASHFTGNGVGIGPAVNVPIPIAGKPISFTAKAVFDLDSHDRFEVNLYMLSTAFKF